MTGVLEDSTAEKLQTIILKEGCWVKTGAIQPGTPVTLSFTVKDRTGAIVAH